MRMTPIQKLIILTLKANGGRWQCVGSLADQLDVDYKHARECVHAMAQAGVIQIERPTGYELVISLSNNEN